MRFGALATLGLLCASSFALTVTPTDTATDLLGAALGKLPDGVQVTSVNYTGASGASGVYNNLGFAPLSNIQKGLLMTTGDASLAVGPNDQDSAGIDNLGPTGTYLNYEPGQNIDLFNTATLTLNFSVAQDTHLSFDFAYGSEEYYYYTNSPYNDSFFAFLDGKEGSIALDKAGHAITVDNQFLTIDNRPSTFDPTNGFGLPDKPGTGDAAGVSEFQYDGFTQVLRTSFTAKAGDHSLSFVIGDAGDGVLDSGVFISHILGQGSNDDGTDPTPEPASITGLGILLAGFIGRRRRSN